MTKYTLPSSFTGLRLVTFKYAGTAHDQNPGNGPSTIYYSPTTGYLDDVVYNTQT